LYYAHVTPPRRIPAPVLLTLILALFASPVRGQDDLPKVNALLRDLESPDFDKANAAVEQLGQYQ
jgi:hypothetical protein